MLTVAALGCPKAVVTVKTVIASTLAAESTNGLLVYQFFIDYIVLKWVKFVVYASSPSPVPDLYLDIIYLHNIKERGQRTGEGEEA